MMRHSAFTLVVLAGLISALAVGQTVQTPVVQKNNAPGVPRLVKFSGLLRDASGNLLTDTVGITFAVYGEQTGGVPLWQETHNIQFSQGHYTVFLGENTSGGIPPELFATGQTRWLGVRVLLPGEEEQPRVQLASVPYALKAVDADTLGGLPASAFARTGESGSNSIAMTSATPVVSGAQSITPLTSSTVTTSGGTVGAIPVFHTATDIENSSITDLSGTISIADPLTVSGLSTLAGVTAQSVNAVVNATQFPGSPDIGTQVNNAIKALPGGCGEVYIQAGTYTQTTTIVIPRCVKLHGASAMSTFLKYTPTTGWAIIVADNNAAGANNYSYDGALEDLGLLGPGSSTATGAIYIGGSDGVTTTSPASPSTSTDPSTNQGDHFHFNRVRIFETASSGAFGVGVQWGMHAWSNVIFESVVSFCRTGLFYPGTLGVTSGEDILIQGSSISNNTGIGVAIATGNYLNLNLSDTSLDSNGSWALQNGTASSQNVVSGVNLYVSSEQQWIQNYGYITLTASYMSGGNNSGTLGYLIDNENANNFTVSGGQFYDGGSGCLTNTAGQFSVWFGALTTSPTCPNGGLNSPGAGVDRFGNGSFTTIAVQIRGLTADRAEGIARCEKD